MDSEKRGSRLYLGRKLFPYFYKPEREPPPVLDDEVWFFGEEVMEDVSFMCNVLIIDDTDLLEVADGVFVADDPTIAGSSAIFVEGVLEVGP